MGTLFLMKCTIRGLFFFSFVFINMRRGPFNIKIEKQNKSRS